MDQAVLLLAHGSRDPQWALPFQRLREAVQACVPRQRVELAYLESMRPSFDESVDALAASGTGRVTLVPLLLAQGGHVREQIPKLVSAARDRHPAMDFRLLPALGDVPEIQSAIAAWITRSQEAG